MGKNLHAERPEEALKTGENGEGTSSKRSGGNCGLDEAELFFAETIDRIRREGVTDTEKNSSHMSDLENQGHSITIRVGEDWEMSQAIVEKNVGAKGISVTCSFYEENGENYLEIIPDTKGGKEMETLELLLKESKYKVVKN